MPVMMTMAIIPVIVVAIVVAASVAAVAPIFVPSFSRDRKDKSKCRRSEQDKLSGKFHKQSGEEFLWLYRSHSLIRTSWRLNV